MRTVLTPFSFLLVSLSGWMNQHQQHVIHYLIAENRVLREQIGNRRMGFSDGQRRRLAARAKTIGRKDVEICTKSTHSGKSAVNPAFLACQVIEGKVPRDGIEPPTPA